MPRCDWPVGGGLVVTTRGQEKRDSLGWEGHTLAGLKDCFVRALEEIRRPCRPGDAEGPAGASSPAPAKPAIGIDGASDGLVAQGALSTDAASLGVGRQGAGGRAATASELDRRESEGASAGGGQLQLPPRLSSIASATRGGAAGGDASERGGGGGGQAGDGGGRAGAGARVGSVDLHYLDPDVIGSWPVRLVQGGLSAGLADR